MSMYVISYELKLKSTCNSHKNTDTVVESARKIKTLILCWTSSITDP
jgi:hypothetical protein